MRTRQRRIKLQRSCDGRLCLRHSLPCRRASLLGISQPKVGHRQLGVGRRKSRSLLDGLLEVSYRLLGIRFASEGGREITRGLLIFLNSVIKLSVIPSAKYSCSGSPDRLVNGNTAMA